MPVTPEVTVADHIALDLHPEPGAALTTAQITDGLALNGDQPDLKKVRAILGRDYGIPANLVNGLYFRTANGNLTDQAVARRYLPSKDRPAEGIRIQASTDDPFAVLAAEKSVRRSVLAPPRTARKLTELVSAGALSESTRDAIIARERQHAEDEMTPEIRTAMRLMLPAPE